MQFLRYSLVWTQAWWVRIQCETWHTEGRDEGWGYRAVKWMDDLLCWSNRWLPTKSVFSPKHLRREFNFLKGEPSLQAIKFIFQLNVHPAECQHKEMVCVDKISDLIQHLWAEPERWWSVIFSVGPHWCSGVWMGENPCKFSSWKD